MTVTVAAERTTNLVLPTIAEETITIRLRPEVKHLLNQLKASDLAELEEIINDLLQQRYKGWLWQRFEASREHMIQQSLEQGITSDEDIYTLIS